MTPSAGLCRYGNAAAVLLVLLSSLVTSGFANAWSSFSNYSIDFSDVLIRKTDLSVTSVPSEFDSYSNFNFSRETPYFGVSYSRMQMFTSASEFHSIFRSRKIDDERLRDDLQALNPELAGDQLRTAVQLLRQIDETRIEALDGIFAARGNEAEVLRLGEALLQNERNRMTLRLGVFEAKGRRDLERELNSMNQELNRN